MNKFFPFFASLTLSFISIQAIESEVKQDKSVETTFQFYKAKNFEYLLGKTKGFDESLLKMHFKLYEGYVNNANLVMQKIQNLALQNQNRAPEFAALKRILGWEFNGMLLHEYYFENLSSSEFLKSDDPLLMKMTHDFGSYAQWKADFISTGLMRGIGWVVAYIEPKNGQLINEWINEHDLGHLAGGTPILIMDVFEHAYITQFGLDRSKYIDLFFENVNWEKASERFKAMPS